MAVKNYTGECLEIFGCAGGMAEGFRRAGVEFRWTVDKDPDACQSYERNLGHRPIMMDMRDLLVLVRSGWQPIGGLALVVADPPCTPWSRAGKRKGLEDERDMLAETVDLLDLLRPDCWLIGNVPGLDDANNWKRVVVPVLGKWAGSVGYCVDFAKLDAADFGVPQHRTRPFWFGHRKGTSCIRWPQPTHGDWSTMRLDGLKPWVTCREALGHLSGDELGKKVRLRWKDGTRGPNHRPSEVNRPAATLTRNTHSDGALLVHPKHPISDPDSPAYTITSRDTGGAQGGRTLAVRPHHRTDPDRPSRVITTKQDDGRVLEWPWDRPATTVQADPLVNAPGHHDKDIPNSQHSAIKLSERAAAILQGFPEDWHFAGKTKKSRWSQLGQAMPPALAEAVARSIRKQMEVSDA